VVEKIQRGANVFQSDFMKTMGVLFDGTADSITSSFDAPLLKSIQCYHTKICFVVEDVEEVF
jgi:hypothetical protein